MYSRLKKVKENLLILLSVFIPKEKLDLEMIFF